ncbi:hypothetical protein M501DRAFT_985073 [Patellaria atrata CBS 101060]|uniref:RING-type E3 ubiquitin transferase n=1 Tax=Patellaria atrata CBS 101060 TaxID=1346257 RepID=A0A9P4VRG1_9PEZI|nr:hypothetical protein M501DRAFT_985073 [Patellaria atrata CBS 101060]
MASNAENSPNSQGGNTEPDAPSSQWRGNRGRGGYRGGRNDGNSGDRSDQRNGNTNQRRGGNRGRGNRGFGASTGARGGFRGGLSQPSPAVPPPPLAGGGTFGDRLTEDAAKVEGEEGVKGGNDAATEDGDAEVCFICASPVVHNAVAPCNHRTCHICSLRLRALYKTKACAHCRMNADYVIFTDDPEKKFEDFSPEDFSSSDDNLGIRYEKPEISEDTLLLLRYNCPDSTCDVACLGWPDLHRHVKSVHQKVMCDLCTRNKKVFTHEHELFTQAELRRHEKFGDDNPGASDQTGFKGHPECGFCRQRFYGDDELYTHCRDKHERCHICDRRDNSRRQQYFVDYNALELHFRKDHFLCPDQECMEKKFVVFDSEMDLKAHQLESHPNGLSKDARRDARRVDMSSFNYRSSHESERGGRRDGRGRGRGRGRDPNVEPIPVSSAQPLRRDELAYQRQMAIQSAQSVSTRTFGGQLTSGDAFAARPPPRAEEPQTVTAPRPTAPENEAFPNLASLNLEPQTTSTADLTPQEQARRLRHNAVTERAANMLRNDQTKLGEFRNRVSSYRSSKITASELIEAFFSLFDTSSQQLGKLVKELAEIFEIVSKREGLLKAWSDWKAINEDYPSLPGQSAASASSSASAASGSRVLKLKNSTAQSSRSAVSKQGSWGASGNQNLFPALRHAVASSANRAGAGRVGPTPWGAATASQRPSLTPSRTPSQQHASKGISRINTEAFPALPATAKPTTTVFSPGYGGSAVRRETAARGGGNNPWGSGVGASSSSTAGVGDADSETVADQSTGQKKKGNKNKKQTLFHFG